MSAAALSKLVVERAIPKETLVGLAVGKYKQYGGVIRWSPGTENAGQIVQHLLPLSQKSFDTPFIDSVSSAIELVNAYQLHKIDEKVDFLKKLSQKIFQNSDATMAMSGLNLAVSAVGFAVVYQKLNKLEGKLDAIQKDVKEISMMLELDERSRLGAVLKDLLTLARIDNPDHRNSVLFNANTNAL